MRAFIHFFLLFGSLGCNPEKKTDADAAGWDVVLKGKVNFPQQGTIQIEANGIHDVVTLGKDNTFSKTLHLVEPTVFNVNFYGKQTVNVMVDHSNIELDVDGNSAQGKVQITGSPDHALYEKVQGMYQNLQESHELKTIEAEFQTAANAKDEKKVEEIRSKYMAQLDKNKQKIIDLLGQQQPSLALFYLLNDVNIVDKDKDFNLLLSSVEKFKKSWPTYQYTKTLADKVGKAKATAIGQVAPEIALPNPDGQIVKLSSLRGKYVLIDFWAKWCGPCRQENPNVVRAYHKYKGKGFEVFSVSLDRVKEDWVQAIREDGLVWTHVSDLKYFESQAARDYNINAIPYSILLDKNGKIIAKNLRGPALDQKLEEVLGQL